MKKWLPAIIIIYPLIEIWGMLLVGDWIGGWNTFTLMIMISVIGAAAAIYEGRKVMQIARGQMNVGQIPGRALVNGVCVLAGALLLLIPGFISDIAGVLLIIPLTRRIFEGIILKWIEAGINNGRFMFRRF
ncbi:MULTISPECIES: FxsA family protein [Paenibacillus]|uniref:FxsA family protein n=1 Tax=Paenibacillus TaxID=44249 RepID=UPI002040E354|nr:FxsA family protein [Paenibacillus camelliae]MCM3632514.1 FxsA family protein [Paenibacillus camelliae]